MLEVSGLEAGYGAGKDVSEETRAEARTPLRIRWQNTSYVDVPVRPVVLHRVAQQVQQDLA